MIYRSGDDYLKAPRKRIMLFGMSGLGKTYLSNLLRDHGDWFHYSVDYRIGTRYMGEYIADNFKREAMKVPLLRELLMTDSVYMGEYIADNFKREAMKVPLLRELLMTDSVYIASNITFDNLAPLSTYLGKPGDPAKGGVPFAEYMKRQEQHRAAEVAATLDTARFMDRAEEIYGYPNFVCDTSGSICEVVEAENPQDPVMRQLADTLLLVWIKGSDAHTAELVRRFDRAPKPMYYQPHFLHAAWEEYRATHSVTEETCDPDHFVRWTYARALAHRQPRYAAMARWGVTVTAEEVGDVASAHDFDALMARAIDRA